MSVLKVKDPVTGNWVDIAGTGTQGPPGGPVPVGGNVGDVVVKTGPADMEVGWEAPPIVVPPPRIVFAAKIAQVISHGTANTFVQAVGGQVTIDPDRTYHVIAGWRCIQDTNDKHRAQAQVQIGTVGLEGYDVVGNNDTDGLWGAWSQNWIEDGSLFVAAGSPPTAVDARLNVMFSYASRTFYSPRLYIIEY